MSFILRAVLLWGCIFGYCSFLKKYMHPAFTPIFTLSSIGALIFVAGLLNVMLLSVLLIVAGGWVCLALCQPWKKSFFADGKTSFLTFGIFCAICCIFLLRIYNQIPVHYDCFSHWLTVVREMLNTDSMPNFKSSLIEFQGYPTGTAGFIYFACRVLGYSRDDLILFIQSILYAASATVFTAFIKRRDVWGMLIAVAGSLFCITARPALLDPLVDTLIPFIGIAVVAIIIHYRHNLMAGILISLPLQLFLVTIKSSGIMMVVNHVVLVMALAISADYTSKRKVSFVNLAKLGGITAGLPAALYYLWSRHVKYVFASGSLSKHAASLENYKNVLQSKTTSQIKEILDAFFDRFFSWNNAWLLLLIASSILVVGWLTRKCVLKQHSNPEFFVFLGVIGSYFAFMATVAGMYLLSMPYGEAITLDGYGRYEKTILIYIIGIITLYCLCLVRLLPNSIKQQLIKLALLLALSSTLLFQKASVKQLFVKTDNYTNSKRFDLEQIKYHYRVDEGKTCFIYSNRHQGDGGYLFYLARYVFWSNNILICSPQNFDKNKDSIPQYDYLIVLDHDDQIESFLSNYDVDTTQKAYAAKEVFE